ncbi:energy transducer TonB [Pseudoroseomonas globiformis]|uniref:Energy transducer TonB n=1 Tax=Teichococcus globiformis TaxID=2307229 RepID=A0ABV7G0B2_9PROT
MLSASMDREGRPFTPRISRSSGSPLLDAAALSAVLPAAPYPAPPDSLLEHGAVISLPFPMRYEIRRFRH